MNFTAFIPFWKDRLWMSSRLTNFLWKKFSILSLLLFVFFFFNFSRSAYHKGHVYSPNSVRYFSLEIQSIDSNEIGHVLTIFELCLQKSDSQILESRHYLIPRSFSLSLNPNEKLFFKKNSVQLVKHILGPFVGHRIHDQFRDGWSTVKYNYHYQRQHGCSYKLRSFSSFV